MTAAATFEPIPEPKPKAPAVTSARFFGVRVPRSVTLFDCRVPETERDETMAPWGERYYSRGGYALGLVDGWLDGHARMPWSSSGWCDTRTERNAERTAESLRHLRKMLADYWREWRKARRRPAKPNAGGSVYYLPVGLEMNNYGGGLVCDGRRQRVMGFYGA